MTGQTINNAIAERNKLAVIEQYRADFAAVLPSHLRADQWVRLTQGVFRKDAKLRAILQTNPGSVLSALLDCARQGLEVGDTYHLLPMGGEVVGVEDYRGLVELIYRAGAVSSVKCEVVRERDLEYYDWVDPETGRTRRRQRFEKTAEMDVPHHAPLWHTDRGELILAYAYAVMRDGGTSHVVIRNRQEIEEVRAVSKTAKHPDSMWLKWPDRAWRKTVLRELSKFVPTSAEYRQVQYVANGTAPATHDVPQRVRPSDADYLDGELVAEDTAGAAEPAPRAQTDSVRITG